MANDCNVSDSCICMNINSEGCPKESFALLRQMCASAVGSFSATLLLNPVNVIKVRFQNNADNKSAIQIVQGIYRSHGFNGFLSGLKIGLFQSLPGTVIYMVTYEKIKKELSLMSSSTDNIINTLIPGLAAGLSRIVSVSAISPIEYIRTLQSGGHLGSTISIAREIRKERGLKGFYRGWGATIMRDSPYSMVYWLCFEKFRTLLEPKPDLERKPGETIQYNVSTNFVCGALSGALAAFFTHPMDVIKTKQQLLAVNEKKPSLVDSIRNTIKSSGFLSLYKGLGLRLAIVIPSGTIMVTIYEAAKHLNF